MKFVFTENFKKKIITDKSIKIHLTKCYFVNDVNFDKTYTQESIKISDFDKKEKTKDIPLNYCPEKQLSSSTNDIFGCYKITTTVIFQEDKPTLLVVLGKDDTEKEYILGSIYFENGKKNTKYNLNLYLNISDVKIDKVENTDEELLNNFKQINSNLIKVKSGTLITERNNKQGYNKSDWNVINANIKIFENDSSESAAKITISRKNDSTPEIIIGTVSKESDTTNLDLLTVNADFDTNNLEVNSIYDNASTTIFSTPTEISNSENYVSVLSTNSTIKNTSSYFEINSKNNLCNNASANFINSKANLISGNATIINSNNNEIYKNQTTGYCAIINGSANKCENNNTIINGYNNVCLGSGNVQIGSDLVTSSNKNVVIGTKSLKTDYDNSVIFAVNGKGNPSSSFTTADYKDFYTMLSGYRINDFEILPNDSTVSANVISISADKWTSASEQLYGVIYRFLQSNKGSKNYKDLMIGGFVDGYYYIPMENNTVLKINQKSINYQTGLVKLSRNGKTEGYYDVSNEFLNEVDPNIKEVENSIEQYKEDNNGIILNIDLDKITEESYSIIPTHAESTNESFSNTDSYLAEKYKLFDNILNWNINNSEKVYRIIITNCGVKTITLPISTNYKIDIDETKTKEITLKTGDSYMLIYNEKYGYTNASYGD